jgi:hypothetical protein
MQDMRLLIFKDDKGYYRFEGDDPNSQMRIDMTEEETDAWIEQHFHRYIRVNLEEALHIMKNTRVIGQEFTILEQCDHCGKPGSPFTFVLPVAHLDKRIDVMFEQRACSEECKEAIIQRMKLAMA